MRLVDAPVIVKRFHAKTPWVVAAAEETRRRFANPPTENRQGVDQREFSLKQLAEDIWGINGPLGLHVDKTRRGFRVIGVVLINEPALVLATDDHTYALPVGTVYHIDGRAPHGALLSADKDLVNRPNGLFGFMAWDVHRHESLAELVDSIPEAMASLCGRRGARGRVHHRQAGFGAEGVSDSKPMTPGRAQELQRRYEQQRREHRERLGLSHGAGNRNG